MTLSSYRGASIRSTWHRQETIVAMPDVEAQIAAGFATGALARTLRVEPIQTVSGMPTDFASALVADYDAHPSRVVGVNGERHTSSVEALPLLARAAFASGLATPVSVFALRDGSRPIMTFDLKGSQNGLRSHLVIVDDYNGTMRLSCGSTVVDVVCDNTLASAQRKDGNGWARLRHTASLESNVKILAEAIGPALAQGDKLRTLFSDTQQAVMTEELQRKAILTLCPDAPKDASPGAKTRAENERRELVRALERPINRRENPTLSVNTLWNAATWLVDREGNGSRRKCRGGACPDENMLFGGRAKRVEEIRELIEVIMADGSIREMERSAAVALGAPVDQVLGCSVFDLDVSEPS